MSLSSRRALLAAIPAAGLGLSMPAELRAAAPRRVLAISTSVGRQPDGRPTGLWMSELTTPYWAFVDAGFEVQLASIAGGRPPVDPRSMAGPRGRGPSVDRFEAAPGAMARFNDTPVLQPESGDGFDAVFLAGGHGTMWDFRGNATLRTVVERAFRRGAVVAAVCHGPAGLLDATDERGQPILRGRRATGFTNAEEDAVELTAAMPYLLEDEMRRLGARFEAAANFAPFTVQDGNLITGQNPASAAPIGDLIVAALRSRPGASG
ncbi:dimethylallyltransferase [Roseomonas fluvialis]|uniref:Dimethylallyltransferase n=2 Tax=Roseomonas fluvialis TaxID=1750527 RepID=A0ABN6P9X0_9PROT|nr:dimethylallyltransferase [Roseomonas fluvialis]